MVNPCHFFANFKCCFVLPLLYIATKFPFIHSFGRIAKTQLVWAFSSFIQAGEINDRLSTVVDCGNKISFLKTSFQSLLVLFGMFLIIISYFVYNSQYNMQGYFQESTKSQYHIVHHEV
jgi:hypothetical protein